MTAATVLIALGSNQRHGSHGGPRRVLGAAIAALASRGFAIDAVSRAYLTAPEGPPQPAYVNACLRAQTQHGAEAALALLHEVEQLFGRTRRRRWGARVLDLDLIGHGSAILPSRSCWKQARGVTLPHPRAHGRPFVLIPLAEVAGDWRHPVLNRSIRHLAARAGGKARVRPYGTLYLSSKRG